MTTSPSLKAVQRGSLCSGCGLCAGVSDGAIVMVEEAPGYSRPQQKAAITGVAEQTIAEACPGLKVAPWMEPSPENNPVHPSWGPYHQCLTGNAIDPDIRFRGSSGGAVSALAIHAMDTGLAKRVLHVTADPDRPTHNLMSISDRAEQVIDGSGSRYAASSPLEQIGSLLEDGVPTVFIGKPCDASALQQLSRLDSRVDIVFPIKLSFFCGGVPSHAGADRITKSMKLDPKQLTFFRFRGEGWPGLTVAMDSTGQRAEMRYEESWGSHLSKEVQFRCKICPDAVGGVADIACADAWYGGESGYPQFDEADGRSLIMTRSSAGDELLSSAIEAGALAADPLDIGEVNLMQPAQARRKRRIAARLAAAQMLFLPTPEVGGLLVGKSARNETWRALAKEFLGTARRIVTGRS